MTINSFLLKYMKLLLRSGTIQNIYQTLFIIVLLNFFEFCPQLTMEFDFVMDAVLVDRTTYTEEFIKKVVKLHFLRNRHGRILINVPLVGLSR